LWGRASALQPGFCPALCDRKPHSATGISVEFEATIDIETLAVIEGDLPRRAFGAGRRMGDNS